MKNYLVLFLASLCFVAGCNLTSIPIFNPSATPINRVYSAEELETSVNNTLAQLHNDGVLSQAEIDKSFTPSIQKADTIIQATKAVALNQSTTQPSGTLDDAEQLLVSVRDVLATLQGSK